MNPSSRLSLACPNNGCGCAKVANVRVRRRRGRQSYGEFETVLAPLPGGSPHPKTLAWFKTQPEAFVAATHNPQPATEVKRYAAWVRALPVAPVFASNPLMFDGLYVDYYLRKFIGVGLLEPIWADHRLFADALCIAAYMRGVLGSEMPGPGQQIPAGWLGHHPHTHKAIDDARGYASLLVYLMGRAR